MRGPFDIRALAKAINRRREELERMERRVAITPAMSRILEADPDYVPYRRRKAARVRKYQSVNPAISTVVEIAASLDTTVGALLGERAYRITIEDRRRVLEFVRFLAKLFELDRLP
jgi:hypothetical protein